jgi:ATP-binding cassette, subfamily B, bacterial MsbA
MLRRSAEPVLHPLAQPLRRLWRFLPLVAVLGLLASLLEGAGIGLFIPLISLLLWNSPATGVQPLLDKVAAQVSGHDPRTAAAILAGAILALILVKGVVQAANDSLAAYVEGRIGSDIRRSVAAKLLDLDYRFFLTADSTRLTHIVVTDCWFVQDAAHVTLTIVPAAAGLLVFATLLAWLNLKLFSIVLIGGIAVLLALRLLEQRQKELGHEFTRRNRWLWERLLTLVQAPRVIRLFGQQQREHQRTSAAIEELRRNVIATQTTKAVVQPALDALMTLVFLTVLVAGYWSGMSMAEITVFLLLLTRALPHGRTITTARFSLARLRGSIAEVEWLLAQRSPPPDPQAAGGEVRIDRDIVLDQVSFVYPDGSRVIDSLSATIPCGATIAVMGESGSGKTTLVNLLCRLLEPQSGTIRVGDDDIASFDPREWRSRIALAGQDSELVTGTVFDNIAYARIDTPMSDVVETARAAGADAFIQALPDGYETRVGPHGYSLSGGQRQRIGLARALLARPDVLILDEATNAVDAATEAEIMERIAQGAFYRTLIVISHRKLTLARCDYGIVLDKGRVSESGPLRDLAYSRDIAGEPR